MARRRRGGLLERLQETFIIFIVGTASLAVVLDSLATGELATDVPILQILFGVALLIVLVIGFSFLRQAVVLLKQQQKRRGRIASNQGPLYHQRQQRKNEHYSKFWSE